MAQICIYTGAIHRKKITYFSIIFLKLQIFKKIHILHFLAHLAYMSNILRLLMAHTPHTERNIDTHRHMHTKTHTDRYIYHFTFYTFGSFGIHAKDTVYIWHTTDLHMHRHSDMHTHGHTHTETLTLRCRYTETHACLYTNTHTH